MPFLKFGLIKPPLTMSSGNVFESGGAISDSIALSILLQDEDNRALVARKYPNTLQEHGISALIDVGRDIGNALETIRIKKKLGPCATSLKLVLKCLLPEVVEDEGDDAALWKKNIKLLNRARSSCCDYDACLRRTAVASSPNASSLSRFFRRKMSHRAATPMVTGGDKSTPDDIIFSSLGRLPYCIPLIVFFTFLFCMAVFTNYMGNGHLKLPAWFTYTPVAFGYALFFPTGWASYEICSIFVASLQKQLLGGKSLRGALREVVVVPDKSSPGGSPSAS